MKKIAFLLLFAAWGLQADDIYLKNGTIYRNVDVVMRDGTLVQYVTTLGRQLSINEAFVQNIEEKPLDAATQSRTENPALLKNAKRPMSYPHLAQLALTIPAGFLAFDYFKDASSARDAEKAYEKLGIDYDKISGRKTLIGGVLTLFAVWNTVYSLQAVEITADNGMIGLAVHF